MARKHCRRHEKPSLAVRVVASQSAFHRGSRLGLAHGLARLLYGRARPSPQRRADHADMGELLGSLLFAPDEIAIDSRR
jgi:hypothetical protein